MDPAMTLYICGEPQGVLVMSGLAAERSQPTHRACLLLARQKRCKCVMPLLLLQHGPHARKGWSSGMLNIDTDVDLQWCSSALKDHMHAHRSGWR